MKKVKKLVKPIKKDIIKLYLYIDDEHATNDGCQKNCGC